MEGRGEDEPHPPTAIIALDYAQPYIPRITTVQINNTLAGKPAGEVLIDVMKQDLRSPQILKVTPRIVERGSCRRIEGA